VLAQSSDLLLQTLILAVVVGHLLVLSWRQEAPANNRVKCAYWNSLASICLC